MSYRPSPSSQQRDQQQQQQSKDVPGSSRLNTSLKPQTNRATANTNIANSKDGVSFPIRDKSQDPMAITPEIVWNSRIQQQQQQQQNADGTNKSPTKSRTRSPTNTKENTTSNSNNNNNNASSASASKNNNNTTTSSSAMKDARAEARAKNEAAERAANEKAAQLARSHNTVLNEEVKALKEENEQLRDIERQFWILLDEREQLQDEVKRLSNGIRSDDFSSGGNLLRSSSSAFNNNNNNQAIIGGNGGINKYYSGIKVPGVNSELEKNYTQMAVALDESMNMLIQLDRTAASRVTGSASASVVLPGTLIYRFLEFCSAERMGSSRVASSSIAPFITNNTNNNNRNASASQIQRDQQQQELLNQMQQNLSELRKSPPHSRTGSTPNDRNNVASVMSNNNTHNNDPNNNLHSSSFASTIHNSNLSQALRLAQDEIQHLKMELDRSDLSRLQALADVDKLQNQVKVLSSSIVELRSAYSSARAQADANAKSAETVHEVTVRLAERDAEIAHLKGRIAEMQRLAASGGSALQADTSRIRQELASRVSASRGV